MAIVQISKIQQRSGNLVDLPQLDEAEFGWASDNRQLYIGKTTPIENIEVLTAYSNISFSQINGAVGNLNISNVTIGTGQVLAYDGTNWVNTGGGAGGVVDLGNVGNVTITGGSTGYVLETDGLGNLSWTSKGVETAVIESISQANPGEVTTASNNSLVSGAEVTITNCPGMTNVNGESYYANVQTSNTFTLYSDPAFVTPVNTSAFSEYANTSVTATAGGTNVITVGDASLFALNIPVKFVGDVSGTNLDNANTYYILSNSATSVTISSELLANGSAGTPFSLLTRGNITASMYGTSGRLVSSLGGGGAAASAGVTSNTQVLFNNTNLIDGSSDFVYIATGSGNLLLAGNANVGNLNSTGSVTSSRLISNVATGITPIVVASTTRVVNLNVSNSAVAGSVYTNAQSNITSVGTLTSLAVTGNVTTGNVSGTGGVFTYVSGDGGNLTNVPSGNLTGQVANALVAGTVYTPAQLAITSVGTLTGLGVSGTITATNITANTGVFTGSGSGLTTLSASNISSGTLNQTRLANSSLTVNGTAISLGGSGTVTANAQTLTGTSLKSTVTGSSLKSVGTLTGLGVNGTITATNITANTGVFTGSGSGLTTLSASNISSGTLNQNRLANSSLTVNGTAISLGASGTVTANAQTLTGTSLKSTVIGSSLTSVGTLTTLDVSGTADISTVETAVLTTGASGTTGVITGNWSLSSGSRLRATYADLAEYYEGDREYYPGEVVDFGGDKEVTLSITKCGSRVAGVVSTEPAFMMNNDCPGHQIAVALQGRVPTQVTGKCAKGDLMVSDGDGHATAWYNVATILGPGVVLGKAIQEHSEDGLSLIEIAVGRL